ncbi:MAG: AsmA-like C-terminal region-containing protein [Cyclonatronaceae bacterium]
MKKLALVLGIIILILLILIVGLSFYLTDERLRTWVLPVVQDATGRDVQIERLSYTFLSTFPRLGLVIEGLEVPDPREDKLANVDRILVSMNLMPLLGGEVSVHRLQIDRPDFTYMIYRDGTTNLDDFFPEEPDELPEDEVVELPDLDLSEIIITDARFGMQDYQNRTSVLLEDMDLRSSLQFSDVLESTLDLTLGRLDVTLEGQQMVSGLGFSLSQTSVLDLAGEVLNISDGTLNLLGLDLTLEGSVSDWGGGEPLVDMRIESGSDDFSTLLDLVPPEYDELLGDLETGGGLDFVVTLQGRVTEEDVPAFEARAAITDGYIRHSDVPERISDITLRADADNELITINTFEATAGETRLSASAEIRNPLEEGARFSFSGSMNADLSTAGRYVPLEEFDITSLAGLVEIAASASGPLRTPEDAQFEVTANLSDGRIAHTEVERPLEDILVELRATHREVRIDRASARSSDNRFSVTGRLTSPLDMDAATFRLNGDVTWDLATVKEYMPIDEDTLSMRGRITLSGTASGQAGDPENATFNLDMELADGYIAYHELGQPIESLTAQGNVTQRDLTISSSAIRSGSNRFSMSGSVGDYMEENATFDLRINGVLALDEMEQYYPLEEEFGLVMSGRVDSGTRLRGRIDDLEAIQLDGTVTAEAVNMNSPDLMLPLKDLDGELVFQGDELNADGVSFLFGESDYNLSGTVRNYKSLMHEPGEAPPAQFSGDFRSEFFNADEFMDYEEQPEPEPFDAWLPNMSGSLDVEIERLQFFAMEATDIRGTVEMAPDHIRSEDARLAMYGGTMDGSFRWDVFAIDHTGFRFTGNLEDLRVEQLFNDFDLGGQSNLAEHVRANFNGSTDFNAEFDEYLEMDMMKLLAEGDFGMEEARITDHPIQVELSNLLGLQELRDLALDQWTANYDISDGVMTLEDFNLTSQDLGLNLSGTQNLIDGQLDYRAEIVLPGVWADRLGDRIPEEGREALKRDDGMLALPVTIRGTADNPRPGFDESAIRERIEQYLRDRVVDEGRDIIDDVLDRFQRN